MLNEASLRAIAAARVNENLGRPLYDSYCFSQIPQAIAHCLTGEEDLGLPSDVLTGLPTTYQKVVFVFIDAFGWRFIKRYGTELPLLQRFFDQGVVSQLTTQFPSTTAVHTTTIHTGLPVGQSGIVEWNYYEPSLDRVISPLLFSFGGERDRETLRQAGVDSKTIFPFSTFYQRLAGIPSYCFQHQSYAHSSFSQTVCKGATMMPYDTVPEAIATLRSLLEQPGQGYYFLYISTVDSTCHRYGPSSIEAGNEVQSVCEMLESGLCEPLATSAQATSDATSAQSSSEASSAQATSGNTLLLISADHGQLDVFADKTIYLTDRCPKLARWMRCDQRGELLIPAGGPRDFFLHVRTEAIAEAEAYLMETLEDCVTVCRTERLIAQGYFGAVGPRLRDRLGNLILLPHKHYTIHWQPTWRDRMGRLIRMADQRFALPWLPPSLQTLARSTIGHHGGLTEEEMTIPFLAWMP